MDCGGVVGVGLVKWLYRLIVRPNKSCILIHMNIRSIIRRLEALGWMAVGQNGSHVQFKHPSKPGRVTVPHPKKDLPIGTVRSIEKQAGIKLK